MTRAPVDDARQDSQLHERRLLVWLFLAVAAASLLFQEAAVTVYDGRTVYAVTEAVIERGTFVVDQELVTQVGRGGHHYSSFGLGLSVVAAVPYLLVRPLALRTGYADKILEAAAASVMAFVTAALVVAVSVLARRFGSRRADALLVGVGGYAGLGFTNPVWVGVHGLLFEPTKSVLLFAPVVVVLPLALIHLWRSHRPAFVLVTANLAITLGLTVTWFAWHGSWSWGPRLIIPGLVPALAAIAAWTSGGSRPRAVRRGAVVALLAVGLVVSFPALIVSTQAQQMEVPPIPPGTPFLPTAPLASPSPVRQMQLIVPTARYSVENLYERQDDGFNYMRYLSVWQFGLTRLAGRTGLALSVGGSLVLLALLAFSLRAVRLHLRVLQHPADARLGPGRAA